MSRAWVQYLKNKTRSGVPKIQTAWPTTFETKRGGRPAESDAPTKNILNVPEPCSTNNVFKRRSKIRKAPTAKHSCPHRGPIKSKIGAQYPKNETERGASANQKHTGPTFLKTESGVSTIHISGPQHVKTRDTILRKQNVKRCPGNPKTLTDNRWCKLVFNPQNRMFQRRTPLIFESHVRTK